MLELRLEAIQTSAKNPPPPLPLRKKGTNTLNRFSSKFTSRENRRLYIRQLACSNPTLDNYCTVQYIQNTVKCIFIVECLFNLNLSLELQCGGIQGCQRALHCGLSRI